MARPVDPKSRLEIGSVYQTKYYGDVEVLEDLGSRNLTVKFIETGYIRENVKRYDVKNGRLKDPSVKARYNDHKIKEGVNCKNSYLKLVTDFPNVVYKCTLCGNSVELVKKYNESNIPKSCGCIVDLKPKGKDYTGEILNGVEIIGYNTNSLWKVRYSCGHTGFSTIYSIKIRKQSVCSECTVRVAHNKEHGRSKTGDKTYQSWLNMRNRCNNPDNNRYEHYGKKGITVCEKWNGSFTKFLEDMGECPKGCSLERIDINLGYNKSNCIWADTTTQANNKTTNILISNGKEVMSLKYWCDLLNIDYKQAHYHFRYRGDCITDILGDNFKLSDNKFDL